VKGREDKSSISDVGPANVARGPDAFGLRGALEIVNTKTYGFSPLLQTHVVESAHFKALLSLESFEQMIDEMHQFVDNIEPYMTNSSTTPSALFCCLYRLFTMGIDSRQLRKLLENNDNPYIRCVGFLFVRFGLHPDRLWDWLGEYVLDDEELRPSKDSEWRTTIGEFVEGLLSQEKYYSTVLPRLPMSTKRNLEAKLAPIPQSRKRSKSNLAFLDVYREQGVKVEVNFEGEWYTATCLELVEDTPSRLKVMVRMDNDDSEKMVNLGKIILADRRYANTVGRMPRGRSRSRSRDGTDWARQKGKTDKELLEEMRRLDREKAVCSSGKEYARKPVGYKAACALPREQGAASHRLMEEETFVPMKQARRRSPSPSRQEQEFRKAPSAEHQARMQQLFEKYGMARGADSAGGRADIDAPDVMRFG
jgi:pre-mRNA-splicing factor 38B